MGALEIRNKKLRCIRCLDIRRLLIIPSVTEPKIEIMCHCNKSIEDLLEFCREIKKVTDFKLQCFKCKKELIKHPRFCYDCLQVYCSKCCDNHLPRNTDNDDIPMRTSLVGHTTIHIEKLDYYCVDHQNETFIGYCQQCLMNLCNDCILEGTHKHHHVDIFSVIKPDNKAKDEIKNGIKKSEHKIERTNFKIKNFCKKNKDDDRVKEIEEKYKIIQEENNDIVELMKYCLNLYKSSKMTNYSIIYNLMKNMKFNSKKLKLDKNMTEEEKYNAIIKYLKKDALILYRRNKENIEEFEVDNNNENDDDEEEEKEQKEKRKKNKTQYYKTSLKIGTNLKDIDKENKIKEANSDDENNFKNEIIEEEENNNNEYKEEEQEQQQEQDQEQIYEQNNQEEDMKENEENDINLNIKAEENNINIKKIKMPSIFTHPTKEIKPINNQPPPKKLKMPSMFEKHEEEKKPEKPLPVKANLKMPSIFEKKPEENKPKERPEIIKTGSNQNIGFKKDFLAQMMANKNIMGKGMGMKEGGNVEGAQKEEKIEIIHESNEGKTEEVINKVVVTNKKKKKPKRSKAFEFGKEFIELPKPEPKPGPENNEENKNDNIENNENGIVNDENKENENKDGVEIKENKENENKDEVENKENKDNSENIENKENTENNNINEEINQEEENNNVIEMENKIVEEEIAKNEENEEVGEQIIEDNIG